MTKNTVNLSELAEIMDRLSKNPKDYHSQAATALRELHRLKTEVNRLSELHPSILEAQANLCIYRYGDYVTTEHMTQVKSLLDKLEPLVQGL